MSAFDRLCWFAERFPEVMGPTMAGILRKAHLFKFPHVPHEVLPRHHSKEELDFQHEFFGLPFRVVAIEDPTSCVLLWDDKPDQSGLGVRRWFIELAPLSMTNARSWNDAEAEAAAREALPKNIRDSLERSYNFSMGAIQVLGTEPSQSEEASWRYALSGDLVMYHMLTDDGPIQQGVEMLEHCGDRVAEASFRNAMTAVEELMVFNRPDRFIVRETPSRVRPADGPKIPRSHERAVYTILHPHEARSKLGLSEPTGRTLRHVGERRRHVRRYPDDPVRWPNAHGKVIVIPATWVGPHEAQVGRRHYSIMLDL